MIQNYQSLLENEEELTRLFETADYQRQVYLNMKDRLKQDILHHKKHQFDNHIQLIRTNTLLKELSQRHTNKKHLKSKCKLVLNSLQQTVQIR